jgi:hypothetical protein
MLRRMVLRQAVRTPPVSRPNGETWPRIRFSRLSEPGLKTTSNESSFLNTPFSETSSAFLRFLIQKHRSSRLFMPRFPVRVQPFSGFTQPRKQRKRRKSAWEKWA